MTIFTSAFARGDAVPTARRSHRDDEPRATVVPVGEDGRFGDTIQFEKIRAVDFSAGQCYLPWCREDFGPDTEPSHTHFGFEKLIPTFIRQGGTQIENGMVRIQLDQSDDDIPGAPVAGDPSVLFQIKKSCSLGDAVYMTLETALTVGQQLIGLSQLGFATRGMPNPNEADPATMKANEEARRVRWAAEEAEREAEATERQAEDDAKWAKYDTPHWERTVTKAGEIGKRSGNSWFGMRFPRLSLALALLTHRQDMIPQMLIGFITSDVVRRIDPR
jgi:hypothetical protein